MQQISASVEPAAPGAAASEGVLVTWAQAVRVHQWVKNLLVFVAPAGAHVLGQRQVLVPALLAFVALSLCASSGYLVNDLRDLESDRQHANKSRRPLASGRISPRAATVAALVMLGAGVALATSLPAGFLALVGAYLLASGAYSAWLKRIAIVDVMVLAGLYTLRIFAGTIATGIPTSSWLLTLAIFLFVSLALVKRTSELRRLGSGAAAAGRGYMRSDLPILQLIGVASGVVAVLVLALYFANPDVSRFYAHHDRLWVLIPVALYWVMRLWLRGHRGEVHEDPVVFAMRDPASYIVAVITVAVAVAAS